MRRKHIINFVIYSWSLLFKSTARSSDFTRIHQIANVLLQELVVAVELVMLFANGFDAVENGDERVLEGLGMPIRSIDWLFFLQSPNFEEQPYLRSSSLASLPSLSISSLVRRGLIALTSSGPK